VGGTGRKGLKGEWEKRRIREHKRGRKKMEGVGKNGGRGKEGR
jgi:hypothetical protein